MKTETAKPKWKTWHKVVIITCATFIGLLLLIINISDRHYQASLTPQQKDSIITAAKWQVTVDSAELVNKERTDKIEQGFLAARVNLSISLKENMNDPSSFEEAGANYIVVTDTTMRLNFKYRGKNGFGAIMTQQLSAIALFDGTILKIEK